MLKIKRVRNIFKKIALHTLFTSLFFIFLALIFGVFLYFKYIVQLEEKEPEIILKQPEFSEETYKEVIDLWQNREKILEEIDLRDYPNPF